MITEKKTRGFKLIMEVQESYGESVKVALQMELGMLVCVIRIDLLSK